MSPRDNAELEDVISESGLATEKGRRLSDKILVAFNHAYASGEAEVAKKLKSVLRTSVNTSPFREMRKNYDPMGTADLWEKFVDIRDEYRNVRKMTGDAGDRINELAEEMKQAYLQWSRA